MSLGWHKTRAAWARAFHKPKPERPEPSLEQTIASLEHEVATLRRGSAAHTSATKRLEHERARLRVREIIDAEKKEAE